MGGPKIIEVLPIKQAHYLQLFQKEKKVMNDINVATLCEIFSFLLAMEKFILFA